MFKFLSSDFPEELYILYDFFSHKTSRSILFVKSVGLYELWQSSNQLKKCQGPGFGLKRLLSKDVNQFNLPVRLTSVIMLLKNHRVSDSSGFPTAKESQ